MRRYLVHFLLTIFTLTLSVAFINWLADPYAIFGTPVINGVNAAKSEITSHARIYNLVGFARQPMDALILGTSRADHGLDPKHEAFQNMRTQNLALGGQPNEETAAIFRHVADHSRLQTAVIGLDFFVSNALYHYPEDFSLDNFSDDRKIKLLFSVSTLHSSIKTLFRPGELTQKHPSTARINSPSRFDKQQFISSEKTYIERYYLPQPQCQYLFDIGPKVVRGKMRQYSPLDDIRSMIALAYQRHIKLQLFISPSHARQWETLAALGLWKTWEDWKWRLVQINEEEAMRAGQSPFPLWDFSGYNSVTTEALPNLTHTTMHGYTDSAHYKPVIGNLILDKLFALNVDGRSVPNDFGFKINARSLDAHLANIRKTRELYRQTHQEDVTEIETLVRDASKTMLCQNKITPN